MEVTDFETVPISVDAEPVGFNIIVC